jgi:NADPH-dependent 2,4-dienoyl-CoA reductase/sulfur reductase-like enzyme
MTTASIGLKGRRRFVGAAAALGAAAISAPRIARAQSAALRVVVVGGGFGGATCARYLRVWEPRIEVTLVEPQQVYVACPLSNRVLGGTFDLHHLARDYGALASDFGVRVVRASATAIDPARRTLSLSGGQSLPYDRLVVSPGVEFAEEAIPGLAPALASGSVLHAWRGGARQITQLRNRIADMRSGGVVALHVPKAPFRCPPGPYERVSLIAHYLSTNNPKAKLLVFDSNPDILAKRDLFMSLWKSRYGSIVEYVPNAELSAVADGGRRIDLQMQGGISADVINVIPPQRAPALLRRAGLAAASGWCPVEFRSYESTLVPGVHVLGDAIASAPGLPKSGHMANQGGKVCAAAIVAIARGQPIPAEPVIANTCYSFVNASEAMHVAGVYRYDADKRTMIVVKGAGGLSKAPSSVEAVHAIGWAFNILHDTFGSRMTLQQANST